MERWRDGSRWDCIKNDCTANTELARGGAESFINVIKSRSNCPLVFFSFAAPDTLSTAVLMAQNNSEWLDLVMQHSGLMTAKVLFYYDHLPECCSCYSNK